MRYYKWGTIPPLVRTIVAITLNLGPNEINISDQYGRKSKVYFKK